MCWWSQPSRWVYFQYHRPKHGLRQTGRYGLAWLFLVPPRISHLRAGLSTSTSPVVRRSTLAHTHSYAHTHSDYSFYVISSNFRYEFEWSHVNVQIRRPTIEWGSALMESAPRLLSALFQLCATCPIFFSVFPVYLIGCLLCSHIRYWTSPIAREQVLALARLVSMRGRLLEFLHLFLPLKCDANLQFAFNFEFSNSHASEFIIWNILNWSNVRWGVYFTLLVCLTADRIRKCTRKISILSFE